MSKGACLLLHILCFHSRSSQRSTHNLLSLRLSQWIWTLENSKWPVAGVSTGTKMILNTSEFLIYDWHFLSSLTDTDSKNLCLDDRISKKPQYIKTTERKKESDKYAYTETAIELNLFYPSWFAGILSQNECFARFPRIYYKGYV